MPKDDPNGPTGRRNQAMRDLRNENYAITKLNRELAQRNTDLEHAISDLQDGLNLITDPPKEALDALGRLPAMEAVRAGIAAPLTKLLEWHNALLLASGKYTMANALAKARTPDEIRRMLVDMRSVMSAQGDRR